MRNALLVERVDGDGEEGAQQEQVVRLEAHAPRLQQSSPDCGDTPERPQQHRHPVKTGIYYFAASRTAPAGVHQANPPS